MATAPPDSFAEVHTLLFDVFGTCVQCFSASASALHNAAQEALKKHGDTIPSEVRDRVSRMQLSDWNAFAHDWHFRYMDFRTPEPKTSTDSITTSNNEADSKPATLVNEKKGEFIILDDLNKRIIADIARERSFDALWTANDIADIAYSWHSLPAWPDTVKGLHALKSKYPIITLSDGNVSLLTDMAKNARLPWSQIFGGDTWQAYKPDPKVYKGAAAKLGLETRQCALVAAHLGDLRAAKDCGYHCVYVERKGEERWEKGEKEKAKKDGWVDVWVELEGNEGMVEAARRLGCV